MRSQNTNLLYRVPELTALEPILHFIHLNVESVRRCIKLSKIGALYVHSPTCVVCCVLCAVCQPWTLMDSSPLGHPICSACSARWWTIWAISTSSRPSKRTSSQLNPPAAKRLHQHSSSSRFWVVRVRA
jgi:hypothetical protein